jgi:hypothetical protein
MTRLISATAMMLLVGTARAEQWLQRYHDAQHTSFISGTVDPLSRVTFRYTFDLNTNALIHFTDPKIESNGDMFVPHRERPGSVITYGVRRLSNDDEVWSFTSDYVRQPSGAWEPVFDFALNNGIVYVMAQYGCLWRLNESDGSLIDRKCATDPIDPTGEPIWDVSPFAIDGNGIVFWTIRSDSGLIGSSLVKLDPSGTITASDLGSLVGSGQIAANNSAPAVSADNSVIYVATTSGDGALTALDATDPALQTTLWTASLNPGGSCGAASLIDSGTSSPVALPDGAAIGGWGPSPSSEGWYYSFDSSGNLRGCYPFGWDDTMGQINLNGNTYLVGKHNHYTGGSSQCDNGIDPPVNPPCFEVVVLDSTTMAKQWSYLEPASPPNEWCIDAPTLFKDGENGYFVAPSESGKLYRVRLFSNPPDETDIPVGPFQSAAYVPTVTIGGSAYTINHGQIVGAGQ